MNLFDRHHLRKHKADYSLTNQEIDERRANSARYRSETVQVYVRRSDEYIPKSTPETVLEHLMPHQDKQIDPWVDGQLNLRMVKLTHDKETGKLKEVLKSPHAGETSDTYFRTFEPTRVLGLKKNKITPDAAKRIEKQFAALSCGEPPVIDPGRFARAISRLGIFLSGSEVRNLVVSDYNVLTIGRAEWFAVLSNYPELLPALEEGGVVPPMVYTCRLEDLPKVKPGSAKVHLKPETEKGLRLAVKRIQGDAWRKKKNPPKPDGVQPDRVQPDGDQPDWLSDEQHEGDCEKTEKEVLSDVFGFFVCCEAQPHDGA